MHPQYFPTTDRGSPPIEANGLCDSLSLAVANRPAALTRGRTVGEPALKPARASIYAADGHRARDSEGGCGGDDE